MRSRPVGLGTAEVTAMLLENVRQASSRSERGYVEFERAVVAAFAGGCSHLDVIDAIRVRAGEVAAMAARHGLVAS